jgi:L-ascorbate metabolism protein UlaG (beta-lactamase superfamily)
MAKKLFPLRRNNRFYCNEQHKPESFLFETIPASIRSCLRRPFNMPSKITPWVQQSVVATYQQELTVTWLGHSSFLVQVQGINLLIDPVFDKPSFMYPRMLPFGIAPDKLPPIHAVLISHNHRDHMDEHSLMYIKKISHNKIDYLVPMGDKRWFDTRGFTRVYEFEWEQEHIVMAHNSALTNTLTSALTSVRCTFVPAHHWSQRGLFDKNKSLWGGWVIEAAGQHLYFVGDTAYWPECFARIKHIFPVIDVALIPIGPGEPRSYMKHAHVNAPEAGQLFLDVGARYMIPMHWGTFSFGNDRFDAPLVELKQWWHDNRHILADKQLAVLKIGQQFKLPPYAEKLPEIPVTVTHRPASQQL